MNRVSAWSRRWIGVGFAVTIGYLSFAGTAATEPPARSFSSPEEAFDYLHQVARNPRCVNCHGMYRGDGQRVPTVGDGMTAHPMNITARHNPAPPCGPGENERPAALGALQCTSCHGIVNSPDPGGQPGASDDPLPWQMPTRRITRLRPDIPKRELCENWQAAIRESIEHEERCGRPRPTMAEFFLHHIGRDGLIAWAFRPGLGRSAAPGSLRDLIGAAEKWAPILSNPTWCRTMKEGR